LKKPNHEWSWDGKLRVPRGKPSCRITGWFCPWTYAAGFFIR